MVVYSKDAEQYGENLRPLSNAEELKDFENQCPHCCAPIGKIECCHPYSSDAGEYFVCTVCGAEFTPDEYIELGGEQ